jgi:hypothetical protein
VCPRARNLDESAITQDIHAAPFDHAPIQRGGGTNVPGIIRDGARTNQVSNVALYALCNLCEIIGLTYSLIGIDMALTTFIGAFRSFGVSALVRGTVAGGRGASVCYDCCGYA